MSERQAKKECLKLFKEIMMNSTVCIQHYEDNAFSTGRDKNDQFEKSLMEYEVNKIISKIQYVQEDCSFHSKVYGGINVYIQKNRVYIYGERVGAANEYY